MGRISFPSVTSRRSCCLGPPTPPQPPRWAWGPGASPPPPMDPVTADSDWLEEGPPSSPGPQRIPEQRHSLIASSQESQELVAKWKGSAGYRHRPTRTPCGWVPLASVSVRRH